MLEQQITLRNATPEDVPFLAQLYGDTRREEVSLWGWPAAQQDWFLQMQFDAQRRSYKATFPAATDRIVQLGDAAIGRMLVEETDTEARLIDIALLSKHRNHGIGSMLLNDLLQRCREIGCALHLQVRRGNPAVRLYQRLGFHQTVTHSIYVRMEWSQPLPIERVSVSHLKEIAPYLNSVFRTVQPEGHALKLAEISDFSNKKQEQYSLVFTSSDTPWLSQGTYTLLHSHIPDLSIFLVPIGPNPEGMQYEAVFSRLLESEATGS
jgi:ribosomal protein S18 acetylase RimI-like enzyme